jgi:hypothetical protein
LDVLYGFCHQSSCGMSVITAGGPVKDATKIARIKKMANAKVPRLLTRVDCDSETYLKC